MNSATTSENVEVVRNTAERFYELRVGGQFAGILVYGSSGSRYIFTHTFIVEEYRGRGLSKVLLHGALSDINAQHGTVTNYCPVIDRFIEKNPEYIPLIDPLHPGRWRKADYAATAGD